MSSHSLARTNSACGSEFSVRSKDNVNVVVRVRPLSKAECSHGRKKCVSVIDDQKLEIQARPDPKIFKFDYVADENMSQEKCFSEIAKPITEACLEGYNGTIFAYGQTGAGKTYTIQGNGFEQFGENSEPDFSFDDQGIMPRAFEHIFMKIAEETKGESNVEYLVKSSYLEIYNEMIIDLLDPNSYNLQIRESIKKGVYVEGLTEEVCSNSSEMLDLMKRGMLNRHVGQTSMNKESSRSHSVLTTIIEMKEENHVKVSRFHIIDLAGSERAKLTTAAGERLKEAGMINKSLSALGNVIYSLVDLSEGKARHIHYRDSKLTFLLRDSLGGNSRTVIICNVSPSAQSFGETLSTLKFAQRAKLIKNKAVINEDSVGSVEVLKKEIKKLKMQMARQSISHNIGFCNRCSSEIDDKLSFGSNTSDLGEHIDIVSNDYSPIKDCPTSEEKPVEKQINMRIKHLEKLLSQNLENSSQIQTYYEKDSEDQQKLIKKFRTTLTYFEKQQARDQMIIKFRDSTIQRSSIKDKISEEEVKNELDALAKEIQILKESSEQNPAIAKLFNENSQLKLELESLKNEVGETVDSMTYQYKSNQEFTDQLRVYIKEYLEKEENKADEKIKESHEKEITVIREEYEEKLCQIQMELDESNAVNAQLREESESQDERVKQIKEDIVSVKEENYNSLKAKEESFKEILNEIKTEKIEGKESEIQKLQIQLVEETALKSEVEKELELRKSEIDELTLKFVESISELQQDISSSKESIKTLEVLKSDQQSKLTDFGEISQDFDTLKLKYEESTNQNSELTENLSKEIKKSSALSTDLEISVSKVETLESNLNQLEEDLDTQQKESEFKISEIEIAASSSSEVTGTSLKEASLKYQKLEESSLTEKDRLESSLKDSESRIEELNKSLITNQADFDSQNAKSETQIEELKQSLDSKQEESKTQASDSEKQISDLQSQVKSTQESSKSDLSEKEAKISELEGSIEELNQNIKSLKSEIDDQANSYKENSTVQSQELVSLQESSDSQIKEYEEKVKIQSEEFISLKQSQETTVQELETTIQTLKSEFIETEKKSELHLADLQSNAEDQKHSIDSRQQESDLKIEALKTAIETQKEELQLKSSESESRTTEFEDKIISLESEKESLVQEHQLKITEILSSSKSEKEQSETEAIKSSLTINELNLSIKYHLETIETIKSDLSLLATEKDQISNSANSEKSNSQLLQDKLTESSEIVSDLQSKLTRIPDLETEISSLILEKDILKEKITVFDQENQVLGSKILEFESESLSLKSDLLLNKETSEESERDLKNTTKERDEIKTNYSNMMNQYSVKEKDLESTGEECSQLKTELEKAQREVLKANEQMVKREVKIQNLSEQIQIIEEERKQLSKEKETGQVSQKDLEFAVQSSKDEVIQLQRELEKISKSNSELTDEISKLKSAQSSKEEGQTFSLHDVKKLVHQLRSVEKEKNQQIEKLEEEKQDLHLKLDTMQTVEEYVGHMNQNQKIKHVVRIKEENNDLKKQLTKMCNQMRKMTDAKSEIGSSDETSKHLEKIKYLRKELNHKNDDLRANINNCLKLCDYILTRAIYPKSFKERTVDTPKIKSAIEGVTYMARTIQSMQKENYQLKKELEEMKIDQKPMKRESAILKSQNSVNE